jgi:hypothetical protein
MMFLDCPAYLDQDGAARCELPAEVQCWFTMGSTDGPIRFLTWQDRQTRDPGAAATASETSSRSPQPAGQDLAASMPMAHLRAASTTRVRSAAETSQHHRATGQHLQPRRHHLLGRRSQPRRQPVVRRRDVAASSASP